MIPAPRWERVKELFDGAAGLGPDARAAFLADACRGDPALREEVESLLLAHDQADGFLQGPLTGPAAADPPEDMAGRRLGPYRVLGLIGHGGMGHVYRAVRDDDQFKKLVAVKLVRGEVATEAVLLRFRAERQILAGLEHPGIARLLDGGATEDGRPFLVMEHVDGTRIDVYARDHELATAARLALFRAVCAAVQHAHENLVVHRDLKPANILVTGEGLPKLLDFGVAKLMDPAAPGEATASLFAAMTPAYASPEQVRGEPVTTATDVYSLGVVLHELLTGRRPYRLAGGTALELQQAICDQEPERPDLPDDLGAIVLKALRKPPQRRYPTVTAFSEDLGRYLEGRPVTARQGTARYLAGKFVRRNRVKVALSLLLVAAAAFFAVNTAVQATRVARERDKAERVTAFLVDLFRVSDPSEARGSTVTAREMLDKGAARIRAELLSEPEVQAALMDTMGRVYSNLGLYAEAQPLVEEALATRRRVLGNDHEDVAASLHSLGNVLDYRGRYAEAEARYREALALRRRLLGGENVDVARTLNNLAIALNNKGDAPAAEAAYREALDLHRRVGGPESIEVARTLNNLALVIENRGDYAEAEHLHREALALKRRLLGDTHRSVGASLTNLANVLQQEGRAEAEQVQREGLELKKRLFGPEHPDVALALDNLSQAMAELRGAYAEAEPLSREALAIRRRRLGPEHPDIARSLHNLASILGMKGDLAAAEDLCRQGLAMRRKLLGGEHRVVASNLGGLAEIRRLRGDLAEAEALYRESLALERRLLGEDHVELAATRAGLAEVLQEGGRCGEAEPLLRQALAVLGSGRPRSHPHVAHAESVLGGCLAATGRLEEAQPLLRGSHAALRARYGDGNGMVAKAAERLARVPKERAGSPPARP